jgi:dihydrofolate synthase / folylpolyglutamate synthase
MKIKAIRTRVFKEKENLLDFVAEYIKKIPENSVLVITSKIVSLSEGRTVFCKNEKEKIEIIKKESDFALKTKLVWLTIKDGMIMSSAGIDESNANGKVILLPKDSFKIAKIIRQKLQKKYGVKRLGVLITDSRLFPLRAGIVGVALGYAGFKGIKNYIGKPDIFGRLFGYSRVDIADSLATSAVVCMGEGNEQCPLALVTNAPVVFSDKINKLELIIDLNDDIYMPLFVKLGKTR